MQDGDSEDVPELFPGYDDNDYDPTQYDDYYSDGDDGDSTTRSGGGGGGGGDQPGYAFGGRPRAGDGEPNLRKGSVEEERGEEYSDDNRRGVDASAR